MKQQVVLVLAAAASSFLLISVGAIASLQIHPLDMSPPFEGLPQIPTVQVDANPTSAQVMKVEQTAQDASITAVDLPSNSIHELSLDTQDNQQGDVISNVVENDATPLPFPTRLPVIKTVRQPVVVKVVVTRIPRLVTVPTTRPPVVVQPPVVVKPPVVKPPVVVSPPPVIATRRVRWEDNGSTSEHRTNRTQGVPGIEHSGDQPNPTNDDSIP